MSYLAVAALIAVFGAILLVGEYFFATGGILLVAAVMCFFAAVGIVGVYGSTLELAVASVAGMIGVPLATYGAVMTWKKVFGGEPSPAAEASIAEMPELVGLAALRGRVGKTTSLLRPSGVVDFDGQRVDALSEGPQIEAGQWVKCVDVKPGRVLVRRVESADVEAAIPDPFPADSAPPAAIPNRKSPDLNADDWQIS
jgi:membrane-bound serine protease (ClpP class)